MAQQSPRTMELELCLGYQANVDLSGGKGRLESDETTLPSHELDQPHAPEGRARLDVRGIDCLDPFLTRGIETKGLVNHENVVVNALWNSNHGTRVVSLRALSLQRSRSSVASITTNYEHHVHPSFLDRVGNLVHVSPTSRGSKQGTPLPLYAINLPIREHHRLVLVRVEALEAVPDPQHVAFLHTILVERLDDSSHHVIQSRAQPTASDNRCPHSLGVEVDVLPPARPVSPSADWNANLLLSVVDRSPTAVGPDTVPTAVKQRRDRHPVLI
mmetsp:Transcript_9547/g.17914  ORF Transcript_9547/g.17914 Transcript_9547/m.17914 type:complete len:272 (-) Transcript_9547:827-1642(-)